MEVAVSQQVARALQAASALARQLLHQLLPLLRAPRRASASEPANLPASPPSPLVLPAAPPHPPLVHSAADHQRPLPRPAASTSARPRAPHPPRQHPAMLLVEASTSTLHPAVNRPRLAAVPRAVPLPSCLAEHRLVSPMVRRLMAQVQEQEVVGCSSLALQRPAPPLALVALLLSSSAAEPAVVLVVLQQQEACLAPLLHRASRYCSILAPEGERPRLVELEERPGGGSSRVCRGLGGDELSGLAFTDGWTGGQWGTGAMLALYDLHCTYFVFRHLVLSQCITS